jgi:choline dehydrogenase-like flavoprotein
MNTSDAPDFVIIGAGMGGATMAYALAKTGARIVVLERGDHLPDTPDARDLRAIFQRGHFRSGEMWYDAVGKAFAPGNYYYVGGNTKFYGAVMYRFREEDFQPRAHPEGETPGWPFPYDELEPFYAEAERLYGVRGEAGLDPTEPWRSGPFPHSAVPNEPQVEDAAERLKAQGLHPGPVPLSLDIDRWLRRGATPWDGVPDTRSGKYDAETTMLAALEYPNVELRTRCKVTHLEVDGAGREIVGVHYEQGAEKATIRAGTYVLSAGAVQSAALLLRSERRNGPGGVANSSGAVGRYFMNHNTTAMIAADPRKAWNTVHSKTLGLNDFYIRDDRSGVPLGNVQLLGKVSAPVLKGQLPVPVPEAVLSPLARRALDWYLMSEDLPSKDSQVRVDGDRIILDWQPTNLRAHAMLVQRMKEVFRAAGYPLILTKPFGNKAPSHQCGTIRMGTDPATAPLDPLCRSYDHPNLLVVDAAFLPTSAAVNPSLTVAAQALRVSRALA